MAGWVDNLQAHATDNTDFRRVVVTGRYSQVVVMSLQPGQDIGSEVHEDVDQFIYVVNGSGAVTLDNEQTTIVPGFAILVPAGTQHNVLNTSTVDTLQLFTMYAPPEHPADTVHITKADTGATQPEGEGI